MSNGGIIGLKGASILFATAIIGIAGTQGASGGRFDRMTKIVRRGPAADRSQIASSTMSASSNAFTPVVPTSSNASYPELSAIPSNFDVASLLVPAWGNGNLAASGRPDVVGAFRFICNAGQVLADDPIVSPGQPGAAHLHQFFGNDRANAFSTYASLRQSGGSSCGDDGAGHAVNRSAYWMPAMLDGKGMVVRPDYVSVYYKRQPLSSPDCQPIKLDAGGGAIGGVGQCVPLPNGLRFISGYDMVTGKAKTGAAYFKCDGPTSSGDHFEDFTEAKAHCPTAPTNGVYNRIGAIINMPDCWDGKNLDSPNHRDHMSFTIKVHLPDWSGDKGQCPVTHPYLVPTFTMGVWFTVDANLGTWHLSSDEMHPDLPVGSTFHADWFGAWDNQVEAMWMDNCINKLLNCSGGDLGNGRQIKDGWVRGTPAPRLVPVPG